MNGNAWYTPKYIVFLAMITLTLFIASCGEESKGGDGEGDGSSTLGNPQVGVVQEDSFYVRLYDDGKYPFYMSKLGDFNTSCSIANGKIGQSLDCVVDINELDLYFNGLSFQYNVPSTMCNYVQFNTYWYYNYEIGYGPTLVEVTQTKDADDHIVDTDCTIDGVAGCVGTEGYYSVKDDTVKCIYDHTSSEGPNCCLGSYIQTVTTIAATGGQTVSTSYGKWGGDIKSCVGGAGKTNWQHYSKTGYPIGVIHYTPSKGLNEKYDISAPIKTSNAGTNFPVANFYTASGHTHTGYKAGSRSSSIPYIIDPIDDRSEDGLASANPAYVWSCLDKNDELINQIRVYVREWNTYKEFLKYGTTKGASGDPDSGGKEGTECDYMSGGVCNDMLDLDDNTGKPKKDLFPSESYN